MALAEAVWIDPPRSYDRRRQIVTTSGGSEHRISGDAQVAGTSRSPLLRLLMRSLFFGHIENLGTSAANGGRPRLRLIAINNRTDA